MKASSALSLSLCIALLALVACNTAPSSPAEHESEIEGISKKIEALRPKPEDFRFEPPKGWSENLAKDAVVLSVEPEASMCGAELIVDGDPASTWTSTVIEPPPQIVLDLGGARTFDRVVIFNRHTTSRGTGGGNNAARIVGLYASKSAPAQDEILLGVFSLGGPRPVCFKRSGGGQICTFIDRTEPEIIEVAQTEARFLRIVCEQAHWGEVAREEWKTSVALSEIMLFLVL